MPTGPSVSTSIGSSCTWSGWMCGSIWGWPSRAAWSSASRAAHISSKASRSSFSFAHCVFHSFRCSSMSSSVSWSSSYFFLSCKWYQNGVSSRDSVYSHIEPIHVANGERGQGSVDDSRKGWCWWTQFDVLIHLDHITYPRQYHSQTRAQCCSFGRLIYMAR